MRAFLVLIAFLYVSCKTSLYVTQVNNEIAKYNLQQIDTLVDIGCGDGFHDKWIAHLYPSIFLILEDLQFDLKHKSIEQNIIRTFKNSTYTPRIEHNYKFVEGQIDSIPLISSNYKMVLCRLTVHEFSNKNKMANELIRILSDSGTLIIVEKEPSYEGEKDRYCKMKYLGKSEVYKIFSALNLYQEDSIMVNSDKMIIYKFRK